MTAILPVSAKKPEGGGKSPTIVILTEEIEYDGEAERLRDTKRYFSVSIGVESTKQPTSLITYGTEWPSPFRGEKFLSYKAFITIHVNKNEGNEVWMTCSREETGWVMWCKGTAVPGEGYMEIWIYEAKTAESGTVSYLDPLLIIVTY
jgi:hypothetical protein